MHNKTKIYIDEKPVLVDLDDVKKSLEKQKIYCSIECDVVPDGDYTVQEILNPQNEDRIINALIDKENASYETAKMELTTSVEYTLAYKVQQIVNRMYEEDTLNKNVESLDKFDKQDIEKYNRQVREYNKYRNVDMINDDDIVADLVVGI